MEMPDDDREVLIKLPDGSEVQAYHDEWMPDGAFADDNYNACGCDTCGSPSDTGFRFPVSWRELPAD